MISKQPETTVYLRGVPYKNQVILADVNIPYKLCYDKTNNNLFFCINADEFSDNSFHLVMLDMNTGTASVIPGIRNGFTSAVDQNTSTVYLGGSDGIYKYDYNKRSVEKPALLCRVDTLDMFFHNQLYFIETATQHLFSQSTYSKGKVAQGLKNYLLDHFVFDSDGVLYFVNSDGVYRKDKTSPVPSLFVNSNLHFRGAAIDNIGQVYFVAHDGIYTVDKENDCLEKLFSLENGFGITFDPFNNMIYSDERTVNRLIQC